MKRFKILSIDWDYFIRASIDTRIKLFPDGGDYNLDLSNAIWLTHYVGPFASDLRKVGVSQKDLVLTQGVVQKQLINNGIPVAVTESHVEIYEFIHLLQKKYKFSEINLYNIDFHHDVFSQNKDKVDCGNWLNFIKQEFSGDYSWISCPTSSDYGGAERLKRVGIESIKNMDFDAIFICRSPLWSPPHLDKHFIDSFGFIKELPWSICQKYVFEDRFNSEFQQNIFNLQKAYEKPKSHNI